VEGVNADSQKPKKTESFDVQEYLSDAGGSRRIAKFKKGQLIFSQDDPCDAVLYIQSGNAKLTIVNPQGKEAVLAIVGPVRMATATAIAPLSAMSIEKTRDDARSTRRTRVHRDVHQLHAGAQD